MALAMVLGIVPSNPAGRFDESAWSAVGGVDDAVEGFGGVGGDGRRPISSMQIVIGTHDLCGSLLVIESSGAVAVMSVPSGPEGSKPGTGAG